MCAIDHDSQPLEGKFAGQGTLSEFDVASARRQHAWRGRDPGSATNFDVEDAIQQLPRFSFRPVRTIYSRRGPNILIPLSSKGLCDAEIMTPRSARIERVRIATAGVGIGPSKSTSMPAEVKPATKRVFDHVAGKPGILTDHRPMAVVAALKHMPAACPTFIASSGVIAPLASPRMPSVPKYLRLIFPP